MPSGTDSLSSSKKNKLAAKIVDEKKNAAKEELREAEEQAKRNAKGDYMNLIS